MLRTFAVTLLAIGMSVAMAQAKGQMQKALSCQTEGQATAICACGPAKTLCHKGQWCHAFRNVCTQ